MKKKNRFYKFIGVQEKKNLVVKSVGLLPNCIVKKKNCIATLVLYCKREGWKKKIVVKIVL